MPRPSPYRPPSDGKLSVRVGSDQPSCFGSLRIFGNGLRHGSSQLCRMRKDSEIRLIERCNGNSQDDVGGNEGSTVIVVEQDKVRKATDRCLGPLNNDRPLCHHGCLQGVPPRISCHCGHIRTGLLEGECYPSDPEPTVAIDEVER